jgi:tetratricopeptide (TPR) repeat protein
MDMLATNKWNRPIYISTTVPSSQYKGLEKYFIQEGLAYRIVPVRTDAPEQGEYGMIDPVVMYDNMMNKFEWGNAADPGVYLDENNRRMLSNFRRLFGNLGKALLQSGDTVKAVQAARRGLEIIPPEKIPDDFFSVGLAEVLIRAGEKEQGAELLNKIISYSREYLDYAVNLRPDKRFGMEMSNSMNIQALIDIYNFALSQKSDSLIAALEPLINDYYSKLFSVK